MQGDFELNDGLFSKVLKIGIMQYMHDLNLTTSGQLFS